MKDESWLPRFDEPMSEYLKSERYRNSSKGLIFSDFEGQEEANYAFWRRLTPAQRLELHTIMVSSLYADKVVKNGGRQVFEIVFTVKSK
ncbi:MAG: hypothetical protein WCP32_02260 [Bacteroidota bacterium]